MLGVLFILLCVMLGRILCDYFLKNLDRVIAKTEVPAFLVKLPAWYLTGTLIVTWLVYLVSYLFQNTKKPLFFGNLIVLLMVAAVIAVVLVLEHKNQKRTFQAEELIAFFDGRAKEKKGSLIPFYFALLAFAFVTYLMFLTLKWKDGSLFVGHSVFSDFAPHLGMIRSFSASNNFPTQYAHFAGEDVKYHFMFQFMVGNLEYLGMRIDFAFNLPSIFGMAAVYLLLFVLVVRITKSRLCGYLTALFFTFRSSFSVFRFMAEQAGDNVWKALKENTEFLGYTDKENWGLWNLNVYCNQRHLAFALAFLLLAVIIFYPYVEKMAKKLNEVAKGEDALVYRVEQVRTLFFSKNAFGVYNLRTAIAMGVFLGALAFWNGSVVIATLAMLFFMAAVSDYRLDYLITALIALGMSLLQSSLFITGAAVSPEFFFGFLAENKTFWGVVIYTVELTGIVLFAALAGACLMKGVKRYMLFVFFVPYILAFTLNLIKTDIPSYYIAVNHKWIMMSLMLVSMFAAWLIVELIRSGDWMKRGIAVLLVVMLTATGAYELTTVVKRNEGYLVFAKDDPVTNWVMENATCDDMFLTPPYALNNVVMGGAMLYYGHSYYAASAGYDTYERHVEVARMYEASSSEELRQLVEENKIRYIIVDFDCRTSSDYDVREDVIESTFEVVFEQDSGDWAFRIFDTQKVK
ncbi:MAG: hypothetical protein E7260_09445 [Lachnospiraceae bacterium]|nr:hypothetical protein [Lachnospiraceae bacterium]